MSTEPLRLGILGLGANWRRWRRILRQYRRCRVEVVFDQVLHTAWHEAARLGCRVAESVWQLVSWPRLDAVLFCDEQWFGLWPLEFALTRVSTPSATTGSTSTPETPGPATVEPGHVPYWWSLVSPTVDLAQAPAILEQAVALHWPVAFVWPEWHVPGAQRLCQQAPRRLGAIYWMEVETVTAARQHTPKLVPVSPVSAYAHRFWCGALLWLSELTGELAQEARRYGNLPDGQTNCQTLLVRFPGNRWARLETVMLAHGNDWQMPSGAGGDFQGRAHFARLHVRLIGSRGEALFRWPDILDWYFRKHHIRERWPMSVPVEHRLMRAWRKQWLERRVPTETNLRLKHYCALLLASGQS